MAALQRFNFSKRTIRFQIYTLIIITVSGTSLLEIANFFVNAIGTKDFDDLYWTAFFIVIGNCFLFHFVISIIMCKIANSISEPIRLLVALTQLLRESLSKSAMIRELGANENYKKVQKENRNDEIGELIKNFLSYIGLSAAQIENATSSSSSSAEFVQSKRIINVYYDPVQSYYLKQKKIGDNTPSNSFAGQNEDSQKPDTNMLKSGSNSLHRNLSKLYKWNRLMRGSMHSMQGKSVGNIRAYQRGYDPVYVNWGKALESIEDDPSANKYVFNY